MILFLSSGRFGNQIFQLFFLESIRKKNEHIISVNLGLAPSFFNLEKKYLNINIKNYLFEKIYYKILEPFFKFLARIRIISLTKEVDNVLIKKKGILPLRLIYGYFQSELFFNKEIISKLKINSNYSKRAQEIFSQNAKGNNFFIHIRHGDYPEKSQLSFSFYEDAVQKLKTAEPNFDNSHFFIVGDDPQWCKIQFASLKNTTISENDYTTDFILMTLCDGGIISNSSFAWLGAYLSKKNKLIIAPKYWMGIYKQAWEPISIKDTFFVQFIETKTKEDINIINK